MNLIETFAFGIDREIVEFKQPCPESCAAVNLGAGRKMIEGAYPLDAERGWLAGQAFPYEIAEVEMIHAYHFFEHLTKDEIIHVLKECQRVLVKGGLINILVPHWSSEAAHQDLDHKSFWSESTWRNLLQNPYYSGTMGRDWSLRERSTVLIGVVQRNLCVLTQLEKM